MSCDSVSPGVVVVMSSMVSRTIRFRGYATFIVTPDALPFSVVTISRPVLTFCAANCCEPAGDEDRDPAELVPLAGEATPAASQAETSNIPALTAPTAKPRPRQPNTPTLNPAPRRPRMPRVTELTTAQADSCPPWSPEPGDPSRHAVHLERSARGRSLKCVESAVKPREQQLE